MPEGKKIEVNQSLSTASVAYAKILAENTTVKDNRTQFLEQWEGKSSKEIEKEIRKIQKRFKNRPIGEIDGDLTGPAWQVAALNSLLNKP